MAYLGAIQAVCERRKRSVTVPIGFGSITLTWHKAVKGGYLSSTLVFMPGL
jgi:hypothetical protein